MSSEYPNEMQTVNIWSEIDRHNRAIKMIETDICDDQIYDEMMVMAMDLLESRTDLMTCDLSAAIDEFNRSM